MEMIFILLNFGNFLVELASAVWNNNSTINDDLSNPEFYDHFPNEESAREYISEQLWNGKPY